MTDKRLLRLIGVLICLMACSGLVRAEQAMFQGELEVSSWETHVAGGSYQVTGKFTDRSVSGFVGTDVGTNDLVFTESELGDVDAWSVTNVSSSTVTGMVVDVEFVGTGGATTSRVGMVAGVAALCTLSTNNAGFAMQPSRTGARLSVSMDNAIRNFNLRRIMDSDLTGYVTTNDTRELDWTGADIRIADATETNQPVTKAQLDAHAGVITNLLSSDGSVDITDIDGPEPDLSVTGYVAEVVGGYVPTNDADFLSIARTMTNWMHVPSSTNWLYYDTSTRLLSGCVTNDTDIGATNIVAGAEDSYTEATRTLTWNTNAAGGGGVETLNDLTGDLQVTGRTNVTVTADGTNIFLDAEGGVADLSGWSGYPATQDVDFATFELSDISTLKLGTDYREITSGTILLDAGLINVGDLNRVRSVGATIMSLTSTNDYTGLCFAPDGIDSFNVSNATNAVSISVAEDDGLARLGVGTWAKQYRLSVKGDTWVDGDLTITTNINAGALNLTGNLSMGAKSITDATNVTTHALTMPVMETMTYTGAVPFMAWNPTSGRFEQHPQGTMETYSRTINVATNESIQDAIDSIGKYIPYGVTVTVLLADGTHTITKTINIQGFYGGGSLRLQSTSTETTTNTSQNATIDGSGSAINLINIRQSENIRIQNIHFIVNGGSTYSAVSASDAKTGVTLFYNFAEATGGANAYGWNTRDGAYMYSYSNVINGMDRAIFAAWGARGWSYLDTGSGNTKGYWCSASLIHLRTTGLGETQDTDAGLIVTSGGAILP